MKRTAISPGAALHLSRGKRHDLREGRPIRQSGELIEVAEFEGLGARGPSRVLRLFEIFPVLAELGDRATYDHRLPQAMRQYEPIDRLGQELGEGILVDIRDQARIEEVGHHEDRSCGAVGKPAQCRSKTERIGVFNKKIEQDDIGR